MFGKLVGFFDHHYGNIAVIDIVYGECHIGYEVTMKNSDIASLQKDELVTLYIKEFLKEDDDVLYGFLSFKDKCLFEELTKLSGLGPKTALTILSTYPYESIIEAIVVNNCDFFSSVSGIGKKLANRIPNEMSNSVVKINEKIADFDAQIDFDSKDSNCNKKSLPMKEEIIVKNNKINNQSNVQQTPKKNKSNDKNIINDVISALVVLGFSKQQIYTDIFNIIKNNSNYSVEDVIKEFLKTKS